MTRSALRSACASAAAMLTLVAAHGAHAHHSFAMFDSQNQIKLKGTVTDFQWGNPHVYIEMDVTGDGGGHKSWTI